MLHCLRWGICFAKNKWIDMGDPKDYKMVLQIFCKLFEPDCCTGALIDRCTE